MNFAPFPESMLFERLEPTGYQRELARTRRIRELAYFRWQDAGCPDTSDLDFWLQAEADYFAAERLVNG